MQEEDKGMSPTRELFERYAKRYGIDKEWDYLGVEGRYTVIWAGTFDSLVTGTLNSTDKQFPCYMEDELRNKYGGYGKSKFQEALASRVRGCLNGSFTPGDIASAMLEGFPEALVAYDMVEMTAEIRGEEGSFQRYVSGEGEYTPVSFDTFLTGEDDQRQKKDVVEYAYASYYMGAFLGFWGLADSDFDRRGRIKSDSLKKDIESRLKSGKLFLTSSSLAMMHNMMGNFEKARETVRGAVNDHVSQVMSESMGIGFRKDLGGIPDFR